MFSKGTRVLTPCGFGTVSYIRMAPPEYSKPEAVSVVLDNKKNIVGYSGSIFSPEKLSIVEEC